MKKEFIGPGLHLRPVCTDPARPPLQWTLNSLLSACGNHNGRIRPAPDRGTLKIISRLLITWVYGCLHSPYIPGILHLLQKHDQVRLRDHKTWEATISFSSSSCSASSLGMLHHKLTSASWESTFKGIHAAVQPATASGKEKKKFSCFPHPFLSFFSTFCVPNL